MSQSINEAPNEIVRRFFFQSLYDNGIADHHKYFNNEGLGRYLGLSAIMFWSGVADFYGKLYRAGNSPGVKFNKYSSGGAFEYFIKNLVRVEWRCYSNFLLEIYRNGVMHQLSPKLAGIDFQKDSEVLIFTGEDGKTPFLNVWFYGELIVEGYNKFKEEVINNTNPEMMKNIVEAVIYPTGGDGLGDGAAVDVQNRNLNNVFGLEVPPYKPCL